MRSNWSSSEGCYIEYAYHVEADELDPSAWERAPLLFLAEFRDIVVIIWGILSILLLAALGIMALTIGLSVRRLIKDVRALLDGGVRPVLDSARETVDNVGDTTRFVGDKVVSPIIRIISIVAGIRRGLGVLSGLTGRHRGRPEGEE
jgi:hypothetical protein